jgi:dihydrofolate reductase
MKLGGLMSVSISFIFAMDQNRAIGKDNRLPWHLPADLNFFKTVTTGHAILMGRKTYDSIGRPLPRRRNVILTKNAKFTAEGCEVIHSIDEVLEQFRDEELFVIGGTEMFRLFLPHVSRMYVTQIEHEFEADVFFPEMDMTEWQLASSEQGVQDEKNPYVYYFQIYEKRMG